MMKQLDKVRWPLFVAGSLMALAGSPVAAQQEAPKVAVINVVKLLEESEPGKRGLEELRELQQAKAAARDALRDEVQSLRTKITEGQFSLSEDKLAELQKALEDKGIELQRFNDDATRELQKRQEKMLTDIQGLVMPIIEAVGEEGGYTMIFNKFESGLVYASDAIDITAVVMKRLNASAPVAAAEPGS